MSADRAAAAQTAPPSHGHADTAPQPGGASVPLRTSAEDEQFGRQIEDWRRRLIGLGIACRATAFSGLGPGRDMDFPADQPQWRQVWQQEQPQVDARLPLRQIRLGDDLLLTLWLPSARPSHAGIGRDDGVRAGLLIGPPHTDRTIPQVQLALGWLQLILTADLLAPGRRAAQLLELLAQVQAQAHPRAAAQEWINRSAAWIRAEVPEMADLGLTLFEVSGSSPRWWVSADRAWVEHAAPGMQEAHELAMAALIDGQEQLGPSGWALPLQREGHIVAVLVAVVPATVAMPAAARVLLRACAVVGEPLLAHWRDAHRPLWQHLQDSLRWLWRRSRESGDWHWKLGGVALLLLGLGLTLWPVEDRVTAPIVIEGRERRMLVAPQDGFIARVMVRPGDQVTAGQLLLTLDDHDLQLERGRQTSARDQAAGKLRQALGEREAAAAQQAGAELRSAQAQLDLVEMRLARTGLRAPIDGLVVSGDWVQQVGAPVENGKELFELAADPGRRVVLHVADRHIARVGVGQPGLLRLAGSPQQAYPFSVSQVTAMASVHEGENGFRVEAVWSAEVPALSPGMQGIGKITVGEAALLTIWTRPLLDWLRLKLWSLWW